MHCKRKCMNSALSLQLKHTHKVAFSVITFQKFDSALPKTLPTQATLLLLHKRLMALFSSSPQSESLVPPRTNFSCYAKYVGGLL